MQKAPDGDSTGPDGGGRGLNRGPEEMVFYALRYYWRVTRGHRLRPWRSPYLAWRLETFFGIHADRLTRQDFFRLLWQNRHQIRAFLRWAADLERSSFRR